MVRSIYLLAVLLSVCAAPAAAQNRGPREVQLIPLGSASMTLSPSNFADPGEVDPNLEAAPSEAMLNAFRVHDLSRQYVEFQMAQRFAAPGAEPAQPQRTLVSAVAPVSSIAVPTWMRASGTFPTIPFTPGCAPAPYMPSGLLGYAAEVRRASYYSMMSAIACEHGIPIGLFDAVIMRESRYNPLAVSSANAFGLSQLMPGTAYGLGVNRYDVVQNLRGGARYLRQQLDRYGQVHLALAAYNAGPGRVKTAVPKIPETQAYVSSILANWSRLSVTGPIQSAARSVPARDREAAVFSF